MILGVCRAAVQAFCGSVHVGVGGSTGLAVGPLGRQAEAGLRASPSAASLCYSYSCSRGIYAGGRLDMPAPWLQIPACVVPMPAKALRMIISKPERASDGAAGKHLSSKLWCAQRLQGFKG